MFKAHCFILILVIAVLAIGCKKDNIRMEDLNYNIYDQTYPVITVLKIDSTYKNRSDAELATFSIHFSVDIREMVAKPKRYEVHPSIIRNGQQINLESFEGIVEAGDSVRKFLRRVIMAPTDSMEVRAVIDLSEDPAYNIVQQKRAFPNK